jgi:hypothetical protein
MNKPLALLLPVSALIIAITIVGVAWMLRDAGAPRSTPVESTVPTITPAEEDPPAPRRQVGDVCQGVIKRPEKGQPVAFDPMYTQQRRVLGLTIVGNARVSGAAFDAAEATIKRMFGGNTVEDRLVDEGAYVVIADRTQGVLDLPEFKCLDGQFGDNFFSNVCGVADRADYPVATVNELDLIGDRKGPCRGLNILYHELGHLVQGWTLEHADYLDVRLFYQAALDAGKYRRAYAARNTNEYFAEGTQAYFLHVEPEGGKDRAWLKQYDPDLFALLARIFGE